MSQRDNGLERVRAHLMALSVALPALVERVRAEADVRGHTLSPSLIDAEQEGRRLAAFAAYLDHYGRIDPRTVGPLDVREILEEAVALARAEIEPKARLSVAYLPAPFVRANPRQLGQTFISLLINAAQALPAGDPASHAVGVELETTDDGWARVVIADTGAGIHPDVLPLIFEPLFSTKRGAGTGLGLAIVREVVRGLGGRISVESVHGDGAMFILELPPAP